MKIKVFPALAIMMLLICCQYPVDSRKQNSREQVEDTFSILKERASKENKNLFLVFSFEGCGWCRVFERYHHDPVVKEILEQYFIVEKIDIHKTPGGSAIYKEYGKLGFPSWTILDQEGNIIIDSGNLENRSGNIGYPNSGLKIVYYLGAVKKAAPGIKEKECELLKIKLIEYTPG
jgi:hypothetical protein